MEANHPLSVGQESLWLLHKLAPESAAYNTCGAGRFRPVPDVATLENALRELVTRHDMLRSVFTEVNGQPRRVVLPPGELDFRVRDVPHAGEDELHQAVLEASREPFPLSERAPFRATLFRRGSDAVLLLGMHHIVSDATSLWLLWRDLLEAYGARTRGSEPDWPDLPLDYDHHVSQERQLIASPRGARMESYWNEVREGTSVGELATDFARPVRRTYCGDTYAQWLPEHLVRRIGVTAAAAGASPFSYLLGVFEALVYRHTTQEDFTIVCPASTRRGTLRDVVGFFVNPILLRSRFTSRTTFAEAIKSASDQIRGGMARVAYPYTLAGRGADSQRGNNFRIAITMVTANQFGPELERAMDSEIESGGCWVSRYDVPHMEGQCDLAVEITQGPQSLTVAFRYDTDLFERETIERLFGHFVRLLELAIADPDATVSRASLVDPSERRRLLAIGGKS